MFILLENYGHFMIEGSAGTSVYLKVKKKIGKLFLTVTTPSGRLVHLLLSHLP
jgi:hypothetical protein